MPCSLPCNLALPKPCKHVLHDNSALCAHLKLFSESDLIREPGSVLLKLKLPLVLKREKDEKNKMRSGYADIF